MTVEAAVALSAIVLVVALCLAGLAAVIAQIRVVDAAGEAARLAARGDNTGARDTVTRVAPDGARLALSGTDFVTAEVSVPPLGGLLPGLRIGARAVAVREATSGSQ